MELIDDIQKPTMNKINDCGNCFNTCPCFLRILLDHSDKELINSNLTLDPKRLSMHLTHNSKLLRIFHVLFKAQFHEMYLVAFCVLRSRNIAERKKCLVQSSKFHLPAQNNGFAVEVHFKHSSQNRL